MPGFMRIFIYPSEQDLQGALNLSGYDWAGGQARPELGVILIGVLLLGLLLFFLLRR